MVTGALGRRDDEDEDECAAALARIGDAGGGGMWCQLWLQLAQRTVRPEGRPTACSSIW